MVKNPRVSSRIVATPTGLNEKPRDKGERFAGEHQKKNPAGIPVDGDCFTASFRNRSGKVSGELVLSCQSFSNWNRTAQVLRWAVPNPKDPGGCRRSDSFAR
jgi:hypothetical protein